MFHEKKFVNKQFLNCYMLVGIVLLLAYFIEVLKGNRTGLYYVVFSLLVLLPYICSYMLYRKYEEHDAIKYIGGIGYCIMYTFALLTAYEILNFTYIVPLLVFVLLYQNIRYTIIIGSLSMITNVAYIVKEFVTTTITNRDIVNFEIQIAVVVIMVVLQSITTYTLDKVGRHRLSMIESEKERIVLLFDKIVQNTELMHSRIEQIGIETEKIAVDGQTSQNAISDVVSGAGELAETIQMQMEMSNAIQNMILSAQQSTKQLDDNCNDAKNTSLVGNDYMIELGDISNVSKSISNDVKVTMNDLMNQISNMTSILDVIEAVTKQTKLLSLNASIEAARAGEAGRGFSVVANEISDLSAKTDDATKEIGEIFKMLVHQMDNTKQRVDDLLANNEKQAVLVQQTQDSFHTIVGSIDDVHKNAEEQVQYMNEISERNSSIDNGIENMSAFSEELLANMENTKEMNEHTVSGIIQISALLQELNTEITELRNAVDM